MTVNNQDAPGRRAGDTRHQLTRDQLDALHKYGSLSDEEFQKHKRLLEHEPDITIFFTRRKAFAVVRESLQKGITWVVAVLGGIWLGMDKIQAMFKFLLDIFSQAS